MRCLPPLIVIAISYAGACEPPRRTGSGGPGGRGGAAGGGSGMAGNDAGGSMAGTGGIGGGMGGYGGGFGGSGGSGSAGAAGADAGADRTVTFEAGGLTCGATTTPIAYSPRTPDVVIAFDRSTSMNEAFGTGTRFTTERDILKPLVSMYEGKVRWGFEEFPATKATGCPATCCSGVVCHAPKLMNAAAVNAAIDTPTAACTSPPTGDSCFKVCEPLAGTSLTEGTSTPTSMRVMREFYASLTDGIKDRYVLLSTDGEPNCGARGIAGGVCAETVDEIKKLTAAGVKTIVLGVSEEVANSRCLEMMAQAGGAPRMGGGPAYYPARDAEALRKSLDEIVSGIVRPSCFIDLTSPPPDPTKVAVFFDGRQVPWDPTQTDGWEYDPPTSTTRIRAWGSYCASLEGFNVMKIEILYGCPPCGGTVGCDGP